MIHICVTTTSIYFMSSSLFNKKKYVKRAIQNKKSKSIEPLFSLNTKNNYYNLQATKLCQDLKSPFFGWFHKQADVLGF